MFYKSAIIQHEVVLPIKMPIEREGLVALRCKTKRNTPH